MKRDTENYIVSLIDKQNPYNLAFRMMPVFALNAACFFFGTDRVKRAALGKLYEKERAEQWYMGEACCMDKIISITEKKADNKSLNAHEMFGIIAESVYECVKDADMMMDKNTGKKRGRAFYIKYSILFNYFSKEVEVKYKRNTLVLHSFACEILPLETKVGLRMLQA